MTFDEMIAKLLDNGIEIVLKKQDGVVWYDLQTMMKSDLLIAKSYSLCGNEVVITNGRYGHEGAIDTWEGLMFEVKRGLHGRDFMSSAWQDLLVKEGYLTVKTTTTTTVTYE
jgi:hypothetical protein